MRRLFILMLTLLLTGVLAQAQTYSLDIGGAVNASTLPHTAAYTTFLVGDEATRSYSTIELRPINGQATHIARSGIERTLFSDSRFDLNASAQVGVATTSAATSGAFNGGLGILWKPTYFKGVHVSVAVEALDAPAIATWEPQIRLGFRYTFTETPGVGR